MSSLASPSAPVTLDPRSPGHRAFEIGAVFAALLGYVWFFRHTFVDDAFISLKYSDMIVAGQGWTFLPGRMSNTATSPLNVIVHALVGGLIGSLPSAIVVATAIELTACYVLLQRIARQLFGHSYFAWLAFVALATNCLLVSTFGLEATLFTLCLLWSIDRFLTERWTQLGIALGLVVLSRPDGGLLIPLYLLAVPGGWPVRIRVAVAAVLTVLPWELFSWVQLGSFVPDTLQIKVGQRNFRPGYNYATGLFFYITKYPLEVVASFALLPFVPLAWRATPSKAKIVAAVVAGYGVLHMAAYTVMGVPLYHWYYTNQAVPVVIVGALGVTAILGRAWPRARGAALGALLGTILLPAAGLAASAWTLGWPLREAPIHTNVGTLDEYRQAGEWLREHIPADKTIFNVSEMGTTPFYAQRLIINEFSDANMTYRAIVDRYPTLPWLAQRAVDVNFFWRRMLPPVDDWGYILHHHEWPNDEEATFRHQIVMQWDTSTRWVPRGRLYLTRRNLPGQTPSAAAAAR